MAGYIWQWTFLFKRKSLLSWELSICCNLFYLKSVICSEYLLLREDEFGEHIQEIAHDISNRWT